MKTSAKFTAVALLFIGFILVNYLANQIPWRSDHTAEKIYTLSDGTYSLLSKIEEPVTLDFYFSAHASGLPISFKNYGARVEEMLRQYQRAAPGKLILNIITPEPDTPAEEAATRAGIQPRLIPGTGEQIYFGLTATQADLQESIGGFSPEREQFLEYDLSQLIYSVQLLEKNRLGLITGLPLQAPPYNPMMMQRGQMPPPDQFIINEWQRSFDIEAIPATATELPSNLDVLVIAHPSPLSPELEYAIDQYLLAGRPVFIAVDPSSEHFKRQAGPSGMMMGGPQPNVASDLPRLLSAYDIEYSPATVTGDIRLGAQVNTGAGVARFPHWLSLPAESFNAEVMPTAQINSMVLVESGHLSLHPDSDLIFTPLIRTSDQAGNIPPMLLQYTAPQELSGQIDPAGVQTLAAMITGTFTTAFPDGPPSSDASADDDDATVTINSPKLVEGEGTLVVIADTDWILDNYSVRRINFGGFQAADPLNDNLAFGTNIVEFLAGSRDLISIRSKGSSVHPFRVVREMEEIAQKRYQEQLEALESRLASVQEKLSNLQTQVTDTGLLVASPETAQTIADFQAQEAEMRRERRDIRRALREDVDALENRLLLLNLFAAPAFVGVFGLWFHYARRRA